MVNMESCLVCLEHDNVDNGIQDNSQAWKTYNIQRVIEKHLWWWCHYNLTIKYKYPMHARAWICQQCWKELWSFHRFYLRVENRHRDFYIKSSEFPGVKQEIIAQPKEMEHISLREELMSLAELKPNIVAQGQVKENNIEIEKCDQFKNDTEDSLHSFAQTLDFLHENEKVKLKDKVKSRTKNRRNSSNKGHKKLMSKSNMSSIGIAKKYDDFIAANYKLLCSICHEPLTDFNDLKLHFCQDHANEKPYVSCCDSKFYKRAMFVDHLRTHQDPESFKCKLCSKSLPSRRSLKTHLECHDKTNKPQFACPDCSKIFFTKSSFEKHKLSHVPESEKRIPCTECGKMFASESLRLQHFNAAHLKKYAKVCDTCGKQFINREYFKRHMAEHSGTPAAPIQCDMCGMKLTTVYGLNRHKKLRHTEENMQAVKCPHCLKTVANSMALRHHIQYAHKKWKHECHFCAKVFRSPKILKDHLNFHTRDTPHTCGYCSKTFRRQNKLYAHVKKLHPKEWEEARNVKVGIPVIKVVDNNSSRNEMV